MKFSKVKFLPPISIVPEPKVYNARLDKSVKSDNYY